MCLAIPARISSISGDMATVELGGVEREVSLALVDAAVGDYVIVHVGIAISKLDEDEAARTLTLFAELNNPPDETSS
ncbi:HypC/HybG/HupF family hydrogenase formation chaperone [Pseudomonadota bacterium]